MTKQYAANLANGEKLVFADPDFGPAGLFDPMPFFHQLSRINRWAGNFTLHDYSVLQHSLLVAEAIMEPHLKIYGLLHDFPECATGDMTGPFKAFIDEMVGGKLEHHETMMFNRLCEAVGIGPVDLTIGRVVAIADMRARKTEAQQIVVNANDIRNDHEPLAIAIQDLPRGELLIQAEAAYHTYLSQYHESQAA
jgi:hypothetical protein